MCQLVCLWAPPRSGDTALHNAARWDYAAVVRKLVEGGAAANRVNLRGLTPKEEARGDECNQLLEQGGIESRPTALKVVNISGSLRYLNGIYRQIGVLRSEWRALGSKPSAGQSIVDVEAYPVFRHDEVIAVDGPFIGKTPIMYFDGYKTVSLLVHTARLCHRIGFPLAM